MNPGLLQQAASTEEPLSRLVSQHRLPSPHGLTVGARVVEAQLLQSAAPVALVMLGVGLILQIFHVRAQQQIPELHKVAVVLILHWSKGNRINPLWRTSVNIVLNKLSTALGVLNLNICSFLVPSPTFSHLLPSPPHLHI